MENDDVPEIAPIFTLSIDTRCRSCIMPRLLVRDFQQWDDYPDDGDVAEMLAQHVERRCGPCADGCTVTEGPDWHFQIDIASV